MKDKTKTKTFEMPEKNLASLKEYLLKSPCPSNEVQQICNMLNELKEIKNA